MGGGVGGWNVCEIANHEVMHGSITSKGQQSKGGWKYVGVQW